MLYPEFAGKIFLLFGQEIIFLGYENFYQTLLKKRNNGKLE